jgi:hypothetical protein
MPKQYEAIRDKLKSEGAGDKEAKTRAAKIYNAARPEGAAPVTGKHSLASLKQSRKTKSKDEY